MVTRDGPERATHLASKNHYNITVWQERVKKAKLMRCACGFSIIDCYHRKHITTEEHIHNIARRRKMKEEVEEIEMTMLQEPRKYLHVDRQDGEDRHAEQDSVFYEDEVFTEPTKYFSLTFDQFCKHTVDADMSMVVEGNEVVETKKVYWWDQQGIASEKLQELWNLGYKVDIAGWLHGPDG